MNSKKIVWSDVYVVSLESGETHQGDEVARRALVDFQGSGGMAGFWGPVAAADDIDLDADPNCKLPNVGLGVDQIDWAGIEG